MLLTHSTLITVQDQLQRVKEEERTLQIPGDWISFAGVREPLSICGRVGMSDFVVKTHAKTDFAWALH